MHKLDWIVLSFYFLLMLIVGLVARRRVKSASDFFTAGGSMPWWLSGISHHMSGYSSAVFVGYAAICYTFGFTMYVWWAFSIAIALLVGSYFFAPRWTRMRRKLDVVSPLEYLTIRYNLPAQQVLAWSGACLKIFDVGAKWTASAILLHSFAGVPPTYGVLLTGGVTLIYSVAGGLWADALTDLSQFIIQLIAGMAMLFATLHRLGGFSALWTVWGKLPPDHLRPFNGDYTAIFAAAYLCVNLLSYNGGTWNLAQRFIAAPTAADAKRSARLSAVLYLIWPLVLFYPMWTAPLLFPHLKDPSESYALLTQTLLPPGLIGLVLAGLFAHTMAMTSSDANAISAVVVRDIIPAMRKDRSRPDDKTQLLMGRICTFCFLGFSMGLALMADHFGGIIGLLVLWYGALVGPIAIPMLLGMLRVFRRSGPAATILSWAAGAITFGVLKAWPPQGRYATAMTVALPLMISFAIYVLTGFIAPYRNAASEDLLADLNNDEPAVS